MRTFLYGRRPVYEVLKAGRRHVFSLQIAKGVQEKGIISEIIQVTRSRQVPIKYVHRQVLDDLHPDNQGVLLEASGFPYAAVEDVLRLSEESQSRPFILLLDSLQDPQNLGTLLRTAEIVGVHGVIMPRHRQAEITPAVVNASSGAVEHLQIVQMNLVQAIEILKKANIWVIGLDGSSNAQIPSRVRMDGGIAVVVGNEGEGMRKLVRSSCDVLMRLPMRGKVESLNAATAGSVALYLAWQARGFDGSSE